MSFLEFEVMIIGISGLFLKVYQLVKEKKLKL